MEVRNVEEEFKQDEAIGGQAKLSEKEMKKEDKEMDEQENAESSDDDDDDDDADDEDQENEPRKAPTELLMEVSKLLFN